MARRRPPAPVPSTRPADIPAEFDDPLHPIWHDEAALCARFPEYMTSRLITSLRWEVSVGMLKSRRIHGWIFNAWALDHGFESTEYPNTADWHRLRAEGVIK